MVSCVPQNTTLGSSIGTGRGDYYYHFNNNNNYYYIVIIITTITIIIIIFIIITISTHLLKIISKIIVFRPGPSAPRPRTGPPLRLHPSLRDATCHTWNTIRARGRSACDVRHRSARNTTNSTLRTHVVTGGVLVNAACHDHVPMRRLWASVRTGDVAADLRRKIIKQLACVRGVRRLPDLFLLNASLYATFEPVTTSRCSTSPMIARIGAARLT
jgi:hypothetical protein